MVSAVFAAALLSAALPVAGAEGAPDWLEKTIIPGPEFILSVGHSGEQVSEEKAKEAALADATAGFVKYCKVDVSAFDRSMELYSKTGGKEFSKQDVESQNVVRAKAFVSRAIPEQWHVEKPRGVLHKTFTAHVLLKVPKEEFDRISSEKNAKLSLDIQFFYEEDDGAMKPLREGDVLRSGDGYAIYVKPSDVCFLYVYQVDAEGHSFRLFPNPRFKTGANPLPAAQDAWIPNAGDVFTLDETAGKERVMVFAALDKIPELEAEGGVELAWKDLDKVVELRKMGVASARPKRDPSRAPKPERALAVSDIRQKLVADGAFAYEFWFWHK